MNWNKWIFVSGWLLLTTQTFADDVLPKTIELKRLSGQIKQLEQNLKQDQQQQNSTVLELKNAEITISHYSQQLSELNADLAKEQSQLNALNAIQNIAEKKLASQQDALGALLLAAYQLGPSHSLKTFLNGDDTHTLSRHLIYYRYLSKARLKLITDIQFSISELNTTLEQTHTHQKNLKLLLSKKAEQHSQQLTLQEKRQALILKLNQRVQDKQQQLSQLINNQKALQSLISQLQNQMVDGLQGQPFSQLQHKLHWPAKGKLIANFGSPLDVGEQLSTGIIIKAKQGTPVRAIYSGKVIFANWLRGFGLLVIINHGNNFMSLYGRNHSLTTEVGSHVNTNDVIATTGSSGGYNESGLYFEVRHNGKPVDPSLWIR